MVDRDVIKFVGIVLFGIFMIWFKIKQNETVEYQKKRKEQEATDATKRQEALDNLLDKIKENDLYFNVDEVLRLAKDTLMIIDDAKEKVDLTKLRLIDSDNMFEVHEYEIDELKRKKCYMKTEVIMLHDCYLEDYRTDLSDEYIDVIVFRTMSYGLMKLNSNRLLKGEKKLFDHRTYRLTFIRKLGRDSEEELNYEVFCGNCGIVFDRSKEYKCPSCGSIFAMGSSGWLLDNIGTTGRYD